MRLKTLLSLICGILTAFPAICQSSLEKSLESLRQRANSGDGKSLYDLSLLYEEGYGPIEKDSLRSIDLLQQSVAAGYLPAKNYYGYKLYLSGDGKNEGLRLMQEAARGGDLKAAGNLGYLMAFGDEEQRNFAEARRWLELADAGGLSVASTHLGDIYREGLGVERDTLKAAEYYDKAIAAGFADAENKLLALMHARFTNYEEDKALNEGLKYYTQGAYLLGVTLFEQAAEKGNARALALLGDAYSHGRGVEYSHQKSLEYYYEAAKKGDGAAQFIISELLEMYPDALDEIVKDKNMLSPEAPVSFEVSDTDNANPNMEQSASYWRERAAESGVTNAKEATYHLFKTQ